MRLLLKLESNQEQVYEPEYHHKLRGVIWENLKGTEYEEMHGNPQEIPFVFSNPFPVSDMSEGDTRQVLIASPHDDLIDTIEDRLTSGQLFEFGELSFTITDSIKVVTDVGEPGSTGVLETSTGVYLPVREDEWDEYGLDPDYNTDKVAWTPEYPVNLMFDKFAENISWKQDVLFGEYLDSPEGTELFDGVNHEKTYSVSVPVTSAGYEYTFVVNKWKFEYTVRSDDHRRWLNIMLDCGLGWRNALGFGFVNKVIDNE